MRIGLNLLHAQPAIGGGWNYISNLVAGLAEHAGDHEFVAYVTEASAGIVPSHPRFQQVRAPVHAASRIQRVLYENLRLPRLASRMGLDVLHWFSSTLSPLSRMPNAVTVYDLLALTPSSPWGMAKNAYLRSMIRSTVSSADILLPISQATAADLRARLNAAPDRMAVIPSVLPKQFAPVSAAVVARLKQKYALPDDFWLYVAHFWAHKNHQSLVEAYRRLSALDGDEGWPLVLRGDGRRDVREATRRQVREAGLEGKVLFLPRLDDTELAALYTGASALIFPSMHEGLGIPIIEAMACGCPVIASALPSVVESGQDAILTIDHPTVEALVGVMRRVQADAACRAELRRRGFEKARLFRSDSVVPRLFEAYAGAIRRRGGPARP